MFPDRNLVVPLSRKIIDGVTTTLIIVKTSRIQAKDMVHSERFSRFNPRIVGALGNAGHNQIFLISFQFKSHNSIYKRVKEIEEAIPVQVTYENECELWNFLIPESGPKNYKRQILDEMQEVADIEEYAIEDGYKILKGNIDNYLGMMLSPSTMPTLQQLMEIGYFDFPRRVSIDGAAKKLGISKGFISKVSRKIFDVIRPDPINNEKSM